MASSMYSQICAMPHVHHAAHCHDIPLAAVPAMQQPASRPALAFLWMQVVGALQHPPIRNHNVCGQGIGHAFPISSLWSSCWELRLATDVPQPQCQQPPQQTRPHNLPSCAVAPALFPGPCIMRWRHLVTTTSSWTAGQLRRRGAQQPTLSACLAVRTAKRSLQAYRVSSRDSTAGLRRATMTA